MTQNSGRIQTPGAEEQSPAAEKPPSEPTKKDFVEMSKEDVQESVDRHMRRSRKSQWFLR